MPQIHWWCVHIFNPVMYATRPSHWDLWSVRSCIQSSQMFTIPHARWFNWNIKYIHGENKKLPKVEGYNFKIFIYFIFSMVQFNHVRNTFFQLITYPKWPLPSLSSNHKWFCIFRKRFLMCFHQSFECGALFCCFIYLWFQRAPENKKSQIFS